MKYYSNTTMLCWPLHHSYKQVAGFIIPRIWGQSRVYWVYISFTKDPLVIIIISTCPSSVQRVRWLDALHLQGNYSVRILFGQTIATSAKGISSKWWFS